MAKSSLKSLWRMVVVFALPYRGRLLLGILSGAVVGGSVFGLLHSSAGMFTPFESLTSAAPAAPRKPRVEAKASTRFSDKADKKLKRFLGYAEKFGFKPVDEKQALNWQMMLMAAIVVLLLVSVRVIALIMNRYFLRWVGARMVVDIRNALFESLQKQSMGYFSRVDVGQLISRCTYDTARIEGAFAGMTGDMSQVPFVLCGTIIFVIQYARENDLGLTFLLLAVMIPVIMGPILIAGRIIKRYTKRALRRISVLVSRMQENFTCIRVVKAFDMEEHELQRFRDLSENYFKAVVRAFAAETLMTPVMELAAALCFCFLLIVCYFRGIPISRIFPMALAGFFVYKPMKQMAKINATIQRTSAAADRIFRLLDTDTSLPMPAHPVRLDAFTDRIHFDHVSFRYEADGNLILDDINLEIPKGHVVAFVGETGSGKTTIVNLLARFYDPTKGTIRIDGHDLRDLDVKSLRKLIGIVTQETILFNDTVAHNIAYGTPDATPEEIAAAARKANAHEFIMAEADGYDRVVGQKGMMLSGGQRQRIAIARAILKNPPILILDEATSALDTATEQLVQEAINHVMQDRTVFAIAHRLSTIKHADLICVLDQGRIIEQGTHAELFKAGGRYRQLCDIQFN